MLWGGWVVSGLPWDAGWTRAGPCASSWLLYLYFLEECLVVTASKRVFLSHGMRSDGRHPQAKAGIYKNEGAVSFCLAVASSSYHLTCFSCASVGLEGLNHLPPLSHQEARGMACALPVSKAWWFYLHPIDSHRLGLSLVERGWVMARWERTPLLRKRLDLEGQQHR